MRKINKVTMIMATVLALIWVVIIIGLLVGCSSEVQINTMTCQHDEGIAVYTYTEDEIVSVFIDGEESYSSSFYTEIIEETYDGSIVLFLEDMEEWYTSPFFNTSSCIYE